MPSPPRVSLVQLPTPLHRLDRASERLGLDLWIKRDDLTGFAMGGNKGRKLEYLIAAALEAGANAVVSCGSLQSNFVRQLGAACACYGLKCGAAVMELPFSANIGPPSARSMKGDGGNALLDRILGVDLRLAPDGTWEELDLAADALQAEYESQGLRVYRIPVGGSNWLGAYAFELAGRELQAQLSSLTPSQRQADTTPSREGVFEFDWIIFASSSGSTQTGLARAFHASVTNILGIACDPEPEMTEDFAALSAAVQAEVWGPTLSAGDFLFNLDYYGPGYGVPSDAGDEGIEFLARTEGIFLDPIYSGKAFAGLVDLAAKAVIGGRVLFWHTGGTPALFAIP